MNRREFQIAALAAATFPARSQTAAPARVADWQAIEKRSGGRLGVAVLRSNGQLEGHRLDERFPMCSTFKWLVAANVLRRVDQGQEQLDRRVPIDRKSLLANSPVTSRHVGAAGMTIGDLCEATVTVSDNAAANLLMASLGGPAGLTRYIRTLGDATTRLDRWEPQLNEARPGDARDTTTPRAMAQSMTQALLGDALSPSGRAQLARWLEACQTDGKRLRAGLPAGWRLGSKTGTGDRGSTNDVGIFWPPERPPIVVAVYLTESAADEAARTGAIAAVARWVTSA